MIKKHTVRLLLFILLSGSYTLSIAADFSAAISDRNEAARYVRDYEKWLEQQEQRFEELQENSSRKSGVQQEIERQTSIDSIDSIVDKILEGCDRDSKTIRRALSDSREEVSRFEQEFNNIVAWANQRHQNWDEREKKQFKQNIYKPLEQLQQHLKTDLIPREKELRSRFRRFQDDPPFVCNHSLLTRFAQNKQERLEHQQRWGDDAFKDYKGIGIVHGEEKYIVYISKRDNYLYLVSKNNKYQKCKTDFRYKESSSEIVRSGQSYSRKNEILTAVQRELVRKRYWKENDPKLICK